MAELAGISETELQRYIIDSNEAVDIKLVRCAEDLEDDATTFHPEMSHQIYGDGEQIFGYYGLKVKLYYSAARLTTYLQHTYKEKVSPEKYEGIKPDEILQPIAENLPPKYLSNVDDFIISLEKESSFVPYGEMKHRFNAGSTPDGKEKTFDIYLADASCPGFLDYHERMQMFILWYIDAASFIDTDDDKWRFFVVYERYLENGSARYVFAGYATVYEYYAYPANMRPRISQVLVLPPFQKRGVGTELLKTINRFYCENSDVVDITVENPQENFTRLRDFVDAKNCSKLDCFNGSRLLDGLTEQMIDAAHKKFKINKKQIRRVYEILRLGVTDEHNEEEYKKYRLYVKNRLNGPYRKEDNDYSRLKQLLTPEEFKATTLQITSKEHRLEALEAQYAETENEYKAILERLETPDLSR